MYTMIDLLKKKESVKFNKQAPFRQLIKGLGLTSHPKDGAVNRENKLYDIHLTV